MSELDRVRVFCPYCLQDFTSKSDWADVFEENHPIIATVDRYLPVFNTPPEDEKYKDGGSP